MISNLSQSCLHLTDPLLLSTFPIQEVNIPLKDGDHNFRLETLYMQPANRIYFHTQLTFRDTPFRDFCIQNFPDKPSIFWINKHQLIPLNPYPVINLF